MRAKNSEEFEKSWNQQIDTLYGLCYSLPPEKVSEFDSKLKELKQYVKIARDSTYGADPN